MIKSCLTAFLWMPIAAIDVFAECSTPADCTLGGAAANSLSGTYAIRKGILAMAKPDGVTAIAGDIVVGGGASTAILRWDASHQVADFARITLLGPNLAVLKLDGHSDTIGELILSGDGDLALGNAAAVVHFADCSVHAWTSGKRFIIIDWDGSPTWTAQDVQKLNVRNTQISRFFLAPSAPGTTHWTIQLFSNQSVANPSSK